VAAQTIDYSLLHKVLTPTGYEAEEKFFTLLDRVKPKRVKTTERLLKIIDFFGSWVQLTVKEDLSKEDSFYCVANHFYEDLSPNTRGLYCEIDALIVLALDRMKSWTDFETVLAHEVIHLLQNIVFRGNRAADYSAMAVANVAIWPRPEADAKYLEAAKKWAEKEDESIIEFEAYDWMYYPKMVACLGESLKEKHALWSNFWRCPVEVGCDS
jgi:hypothetical protein